jgi:hypothetical protein
MNALNSAAGVGCWLAMRFRPTLVPMPNKHNRRRRCNWAGSRTSRLPLVRKAAVKLSPRSTSLTMSISSTSDQRRPISRFRAAVFGGSGCRSSGVRWLQNVKLHRPAHAGLNKGEARNALARALFIHRLGEIRDQTFEQQRYRASGLNLVTAAIVLWNTVYLERAAQALRDAGSLKDDSLQQYMSPLGWEHINLTGDYVWRQNRKVDEGQFRPLRKRENP